MRSLVVRRRSYEALSKSRPGKLVSSSAGTRGELFSPDSRERSDARERACFAARRANGATKSVDGYGIHGDIFGKLTVLGNILRKLQGAIIRRGWGRGDIIHDTWGSVKRRKDGAEASCSPHSSASAAASMRAVNTRSLALDKPNSRTARCVPPAPGMIPRRTSGRPILVTSCATTLSARHPTPERGNAYQPRASRKQS